MQSAADLVRAAASARPRLRVYAVGLSAVLTLVGCTSSGSGNVAGGRTPGTDSSAASAEPTAVATRWWSNGAEAVGSTIDPKNPGAGAANLQPSRPEYCAMLQQTVTAGASILPGVSAQDPALLASTEAFVTEIQHLAPDTAHAAWQTLGSAVITIVKSGGDASKIGAVDQKSVSAAEAVIAADAKTSCGLDLSAAGPSSAPSK